MSQKQFCLLTCARVPLKVRKFCATMLLYSAALIAGVAFNFQRAEPASSLHNRHQLRQLRYRPRLPPVWFGAAGKKCVAMYVRSPPACQCRVGQHTTRGTYVRGTCIAEWKHFKKAPR